MGGSAGTAALLRRALRGRAGRAWLAGAGIAAATVLVLALLAAYRGATRGVVAYAGQEGCDVWVAPRGIDNLVRSAGQLSSGAEAAVRAIPGVADVAPILRSFATVDAGPPGARRRVTVLVVGHRVPAGLGGPPRLVSGRGVAAAGEVALDRAAAHRLGVRVGDAVEVAGDRARVVGLTAHTNLLATQFAFVDLQAADDAMGALGRPSFLAVRLAPGASAEEVARAIEGRVERASAYPRPVFVRNNAREIASGVLPVMALVSGLGLAVAVALVALLAQGLAEDRRRDVAVLLALGASPRQVAVAVATHVEAVVAAGAAAGTATATAAASLLERHSPSVELALRVADAALVPAVFCAAAALAALAPVARLRRVEPVEAFRP